MSNKTVLVHSTAYTRVFMVAGILVVVLPAGLLLGDNIAKAVPSLLLATALPTGIFFLMIRSFYMILELDGSLLTFRGMFGKTTTRPVEELEIIVYGRALYSFFFAGAVDQSPGSKSSGGSPPSGTKIRASPLMQ